MSVQKKRLPVVLLRRLPVKASPSLPKKPHDMNKKRKMETPLRPRPKESEEWEDCRSSGVNFIIEDSIEIARDAESEYDDISLIENSIHEILPKNSTFQDENEHCNMERFFQPNLSPIPSTPSKSDSENEQPIPPERPTKASGTNSGVKKLKPKAILQKQKQVEEMENSNPLQQNSRQEQEPEAILQKQKQVEEPENCNAPQSENAHEEQDALASSHAQLPKRTTKRSRKYTRDVVTEKEGNCSSSRNLAIETNAETAAVAPSGVKKRHYPKCSITTTKEFHRRINRVPIYRHSTPLPLTIPRDVLTLKFPTSKK